MKGKVYSENARGESEKHIREIRQLLNLISVEVEKYESLKRFHYGHVGDLGHIEEVLNEAWEFISETD
jgi:hypothetical protein